MVDSETRESTNMRGGNDRTRLCRQRDCRTVQFFIPGLGQLVQGRLLMAAIHFVFAAVLWIILLGWIIHLWSIIDAALWKPKTTG